jgi:AraC-like DNA-binding protein
MSSGSRAAHSLPAIHVIHLVDLVKRWGVEPDELLGPLDLAAGSLSIPGARLPVDVIEEAVVRATALTGEPGLGFAFGMQMKVSWHGFLGFAAMCAPTVRHAIELACEFAPTRTSAIALRLDDASDPASLVIEEQADLGRAREAILFALAVGVWQIGNRLTGQPLVGSAQFAFPAPDYLSRFGELVPVQVRFSQPDTRLSFARELLALPLVMHDPAALELARRQCEQELAAIRGEDGVVGQLRALLRAGDGLSLTGERAARELGMSARTLKRKLSQHGTSFSDLVAHERRRLATRMLRAGASVDEIADRLGYADAQSFSRAFRRWTDMTPSAYRKLVSPRRP